MPTKKSHTMIPILICAGRLVYFGRVLEGTDLTTKTLRLEGARNCIRWTKTIGGIGGLAQHGPNAECRIGALVPWQIVHDVTIVRGCTPEAAAKWDAAEAVS